MSIEKRFFGKLDGKGDVDIYKITNKNGAFVELMTLGAGIHSINVPDRNGKLGDVVLGFDDVDNYLKNIPGAYNIFQKDNGIEYLNDCEELSSLANFDYYYNKLKKLNCLRDLKKMGFSVDKIYSEEISEEAKKINERFETLTISDIIEICKKGISGIENKYNSKYTNTDWRAGDDIDELIEQFKINR